MDEIIGGVVNLLHAAARALDAFATHREIVAEQLTLDVAIKRAQLRSFAIRLRDDGMPPSPFDDEDAEEGSGPPTEASATNGCTKEG